MSGNKGELEIEQQRPDEMKSELNIFNIYRDTLQGKNNKWTKPQKQESYEDL